MKKTEKKLEKEIENQIKQAMDEKFIILKDGEIEDLNGILKYLMEEAMSSSGGIERSELRENLIRLGKIAVIESDRW